MSYDPKQFARRTVALGKVAPEVSRRFGALHQTALADGALSTSVKELMALAISVATGCEDCCGHHLERALDAGATPEQVSETLGVAVLMGGGPAYTYAAKVAGELDADT